MSINPKEKQGARYRRLSMEMYADAKFRALSQQKPSGQGLWIYLLTGPFSTLIPGICIGGEAGISEALAWPLAAFRRCCQEILTLGMAKADWAARVIWLPNAARHNPPQSPSVVTGWRQAWIEVPACALKTEAALHMRGVLAETGDAYRSAFDAFAFPHAPRSDVVPQPATQVGGQPAPHQEQEQEQEQDLPPEPPAGGRGVRGSNPRRPHALDEPVQLSPASLAALDQFLEAYPRKEGRRGAVAAWHVLLPSPVLAAQIVADVNDRVKRGWANELRFVPFPAKYLVEHRWEEPWTPPVLRRAVDDLDRARTVPDADKTAGYLANLRAGQR